MTDPIVPDPLTTSGDRPMEQVLYEVKKIIDSLPGLGF